MCWVYDLSVYESTFDKLTLCRLLIRESSQSVALIRESSHLYRLFRFRLALAPPLGLAVHAAAVVHLLPEAGHQDPDPVPPASLDVLLRNGRTLFPTIWLG